MYWALLCLVEAQNIYGQSQDGKQWGVQRISPVINEPKSGQL